MFESFGTLSGGISSMKVGASPGRTLAARYPKYKLKHYYARPGDQSSRGF
ncbi:hypothetical protein [Methanosarcina mazei]|jgi:hypothetical protein|uniref:Uncharacterized protein n=1 Tax=Methanosarcina mazei Tuc01 TaxID=1236903 RepID=M1Q9P1_METMZ|nr:hypothetical protein [Methanosarcina mazei]AGF96898.1 hypothetical protein MmTuc01_1534 [Methanosarcina mazei Tuc01]BBL65956.1 hypothetical protein MmazTMA_29330 [Methanosarcina mazei]